MRVRGFLFSLFLILCQVHAEAKDVTPYLLPNDHPIKAKLDAIFSKSRAVFNEKTMAQAGFINPKPRKITRLIVTRHPDLAGYVIKAYLDSQQYHKGKSESDLWVLRIEGKNRIAKVIAGYSLGAFFKVPEKWIYELPKSPKPSKDFLAKNYILVEEDMETLDDVANEQMWKSPSVQQEHLTGLFIILKKVGLRDCVKPDNIPFTKDGRIAFIDTQSHGYKVIFSEFNKFLSQENRILWKKITTGD